MPKLSTEMVNWSADLQNRVKTVSYLSIEAEKPLDCVISDKIKATSRQMPLTRITGVGA